MLPIRRRRIASGVLGGGSVPLPDPSGGTFSWLPFSIYANGDGTFNVGDFNLQARAGINVTKTYYVDYATGNDGNTGADWANALKGVHAALGKADVDRIYVKAGLYTYGYGWDFLSPARDIELIGVNGQVILSPHTAGLSWTAVDSHYTAPLATCQGVLDASNVDGNGDRQRLTVAANEAACDGTVSTWWHDGVGTLHVHTFDGREPDANIWPYLSAILNMYINDPNTFYFEGIDFYGIPALLQENLGANAYFKDCEFKYSFGATSDCTRVRGVDEVIFQDCLFAKSLGGDGLHADELSGVASHVVLIDCISRNNGNSTVTNANSHSSHGGQITVFINCEFYGNWGRTWQDVIDGGTPTAWALGCNCHDPVIGGVADGNYATDGTMWLDTCISSGASWDVEPSGAGTIYVRNTTPVFASLVEGASTNGNVVAY